MIPAEICTFLFCLMGCSSLELSSRHGEEALFAPADLAGVFRPGIEISACLDHQQLKILTTWWFGTFIIFPYIGYKNFN